MARVRVRRPIFACMRTAFTLVEVLVAIVVLTIGLLAVAATAALVATHVGDGARLTSAAHAARSILDSLGGRDCAAVMSGSTARDGVSVVWSATRDSSAAQVELSVASQLRRARRRDAYRVLVPCARD